MESLGILAGGIAHDFNNLMGSIVGHASLLRMTSDPELGHHAELIEKSVRRGKALTDQLLAFARGGSGRREALDLNEIVDETLKILSRTLDRSIEISRFLASDLPPVVGDPGQLQQVVMNLCLNAREAMPEGGALTVETKLVPSLPKVSTPPVPEDSRNAGLGLVRLVVRDTGQGIDPDLRDRIFEPFVSTKEGGRGTGLGLAVVYGIVTQHQGTVDVESRAGAGSSFTVYLPASPTSTSPREPIEHAPPRGTERVLVADDDEDLLLVIQEALESHGYSVITARDGSEAVKRYRDNQGRVDLVILDMIMPRKGGRQVFREIRSLDSNARILLTTGYAGHQDTASLLDQGALGCIQKPCTAYELLTAVRRAVEAPRS
jgi:CheY-like chemotaxis protein